MPLALMYQPSFRPALPVDHATDQVAVEQSQSNVRRGKSARHDHVADAFDLGEQFAACFHRDIDGHRFEGNLCADWKTAERGQIRGNDSGDLRVAAGGLTIRQQHDRLAVARHLDRSGAMASEAML